MRNIPVLPPPTSTPTEWSEVERKLLIHLDAMGWQIILGDIDVPYLTERESFRQFILVDRLSAPIRKINAADGPLEDLTVERAIRALLDVPHGQGLLQRNRIITDRLIRGVAVDPVEADASQRQRWIRFIDFENLANNDFVAINQFRIDLPGSNSFVVPDIVLFVNGLPLVVIECKSPAITDPIGEGMDQILRYSNNRPWIGENEGAEDLFLFNQLMVVTSFFNARVGALGALHEYYGEWKDTTPVLLEDVAGELGKTADKLKPQELLAAGLLRPARLIDTLGNFVLFTTEDGRLIKVIPRYQQVRAVYRAIDRMLTGKLRREDTAGLDRRGGVIWHTQGSGKSITMVYLVRKMRTIPKLKGFKIVVVTDRRQLEDQLRDSAELSGHTIRPDDEDERRAGSTTERLKSILREDSPDIVFAMIQKYLERTGPAEVFEYTVPVKQVSPSTEADATAPHITKGTHTLRKVVREQNFEELNNSEKVLILVDECHRSNTNTFHANMMKALPNAAKIGFTGTPIMHCDAAGTRAIFGEFIDAYRLQESVQDRATVRIIYEGRTAEGLVEHTDRLDAQFEDMFRDCTEVQKQRIKEKYATTGDVLEAPKLISLKSRDMLRHYVRKILPSGFKAQVVAVSREAARRYQQALGEARDELVQQIMALDASKLRLNDEDLEREPETIQFLVRASKHLELIRELQFAAVISHDHNDPPSWREWTDKARQDSNIANFKKPFRHDKPDKRSPVAFLCVQNMLLTGFNAPIEQVLYLDRKLVAHDLLQAIARVNRTSKGKDSGFVVDYIGVARHLNEALGDYLDETRQPMTDLIDELPRLRDRHQRVIDLFREHGIDDIRNIEGCVDLLADVAIRADFINRLRAFLDSLDTLMPRPEAIQYLRDAKILGFIAKVAANLYYDEQLNLYGVKPKVKQLIDEYVSAHGINPTIPPINILDGDFEKAVHSDGSARTRASRMLHAARHHIEIHGNEDPTYYCTLSDRLEKILQDLKDNWEELEKALRGFIDDEIKRGREHEVNGIEPKIDAPFFGVIKLVVETETGTALSGDILSSTVALTHAIVGQIQAEIGRVGFWRDAASRIQLERQVYRIVRRSGLVPQEKANELAVRLVELAKHRHRFLINER